MPLPLRKFQHAGAHAALNPAAAGVGVSSCDHGNCHAQPWSSGPRISPAAAAAAASADHLCLHSLSCDPAPHLKMLLGPAQTEQPAIMHFAVLRK